MSLISNVLHLVEQIVLHFFLLGLIELVEHRSINAPLVVKDVKHYDWEDFGHQHGDIGWLDHLQEREVEHHLESSDQE